MKPEVLVVFGTRPEAIKLAPVVRALRRFFTVRVCATAQHRQMLDQVLRLFDIVPDYDLDLMRENQNLYDTTARALEGLRPVIEAENPKAVVVQGDTTTTFAAALAAYYARIPVAHVEAGLRTGDPYRPFPEEGNRRLTTHLARWHFAPTEKARENLAREGIPAESTFVTGNPGIDALSWVAERIRSGELRVDWPPGLAGAFERRNLLLVTGHRRESFGPGFERICRALRTLASRHRDLSVVYPVHLNPNVREPVFRLLAGVPGIYLTEPLDYAPFVALMQRADLVLTDSGGIQEEAPALRKPVLVMREKTERPEAIEAGVAALVGTDEGRIVEAVGRLLEKGEDYRRMASGASPYGDGRAALRIAEILARELGALT
ncbi:MAG: UDP-N-acetylglucosamine 2-epimerase [Candidatus Binatia bacterium]|nr:MAG: UDP-N-acetylglucosamine 2-epimerase [Candidatus Binatia bacterium]